MVSSTTGTGHRRSHFSAGWATTPLPLKCQKRTEYTISKETCWPWRFWKLALASMFTRPHASWFFLWGFIKQQVYGPPLPPTIEDLRVRITGITALEDDPMLQRVWQEVGYRTDVCRVTQGAHIEHLWFTYSCGPNVSLSVSCFRVDQFLEFLFLLIPISWFRISLIQE